MTGPYQPPGGDVNSPFGPSDPNSPFTPGPGSMGSDAKDEGPKGENKEEDSPYQGVQYQLETPGAPPVTPPPPGAQPGYGVTPPPPPPPPAYAPQPQPTFAPMPPKKSNNGLLIGGLVAGGVVVFLLIGIVFVAVAISAGEESGGGGGDTTDRTYTLPSAPCDDVDLSSITAILSFSTEPSGTTNDYGTYGSAMCTGGSLGDYSSSYGSFNMYMYTYEDVEGAESMYQTDTSSTSLGSCDTTEVSGSWSKGTLATGGTECAYGYAGYNTVLVIQDANLEAKITLDLTSDMSGTDTEDALKSVAESLLTASKA